MTNREWDTYAELIREGAVDPTQRAWIAWVDLQHRWTSEDVDPPTFEEKFPVEAKLMGRTDEAIAARKEQAELERQESITTEEVDRMFGFRD